MLPSMEGWLVVVTVSQLDQHSPAKREFWAASIADEHRAVALVAQKSGGSIPDPIFRLNQAAFEGLGIRDHNAVVRIVAEGEAKLRT